MLTKKLRTYVVRNSGKFGKFHIFIIINSKDFINLPKLFSYSIKMHN